MNILVCVKACMCINSLYKEMQQSVNGDDLWTIELWVI